MSTLDPGALEAAKAAADQCYRHAVADQTAILGAAIQAYLDALWQPIEEAPADGTNILAYAKGQSASPLDVFYGVAQWTIGVPEMGFVPGWFWDFAIRPTHWCPLPAPPKSEPKP